MLHTVIRRPMILNTWLSLAILNCLSRYPFLTTIIVGTAVTVYVTQLFARIAYMLNHIVRHFCYGEARFHTTIAIPRLWAAFGSISSTMAHHDNVSVKLSFCVLCELSK